MNEYKEKIHNGLTGEITWRDYTEAEIVECKVNEAKAKALLDSFTNAEAQKAADKASAQAKLAALGLTQEEIAALSN